MDTTFQKKVINSYAEKHKIKGQFVEDKNLDLSNQNLHEHKTLFVSNLMCFNSNLEGIKQTLSDLILSGLNVVSIEDGFEFFSNEKSADILKGIEIAIQIKAFCTSYVMKNKLAQKKKNGETIGRHKGSKNLAPSKCELNKKYIFQALKRGKTKNAIAQEVGVSIRTLFNFLKLNENKGYR